MATGEIPAYEAADGVVYNRNGEVMTVDKASLEKMRSVSNSRARSFSASRPLWLL
jgi:hypothetical protein